VTAISRTGEGYASGDYVRVWHRPFIGRIASAPPSGLVFGGAYDIPRELVGDGVHDGLEDTVAVPQVRCDHD
jgi:hypothetical protein